MKENMATSVTSLTLSDSPEAEAPLLDAAVEDAVDHKGRPVYRRSSGGWRSASFVIGFEVAEKFAFSGISSNLINYLTGPLGQSMVKAAEQVNVWSGTATLLPLVGGVVGDAFIGRYCTIVFASGIYILGLGLLALSTMIYSPSASDCNPDRITTCFPPQIQVILLFFALYLVAVGEGGHKPCLQAFGADQFDGQDPEELKAKSSFFNWWYFGLCLGIVFTHLILNYIQDNLNWTLGFGIPCIVMVMGLVIFLLGTKTYRYGIKGDEESPLLRIGRVFVYAARNWKTTTLALDYVEVTCGKFPQQSSEQFNFLNKALLARDGKQCSISEVEEAKTILRLVPIWATCLVYAILFAQTPTFFTKQGGTMVRSVVPGFDIPAASLQLFTKLTVVLFIPIYDRIIVPTARTLTGKPSGITMLQRIGIGIFLSATSMVSAAIVEMKRLKTAEEYGLLDTPNVTVPMSVWWLVPQYVLFGVSEAFTIAGLQEFFYDQVPIELGSVGISLYLSVFGVGSFLSSFLVSVIDKTAGGIGRQSWFIDNINRAHLDYFFWLLAVLSVIEMAAFFYFTKSYVYSRKSRT